MGHPAGWPVACLRKLRCLRMTDVIFVALTVAVFVILGLVVKAVERL
ncbi:hypothetical protein HNP84_005323 [Thermocatellispora tengchongensis]|uniref:Uncharacterized protein n=1 Tax=Thermocatellispora tengchongensis TaxID=1073253 RepID=A0A840P9A1_9ACTN|nr:hypothetical protein [Thermocatellispora tengchongensis]